MRGVLALLALAAWAAGGDGKAPPAEPAFERVDAYDGSFSIELPAAWKLDAAPAPGAGLLLSTNADGAQGRVPPPLFILKVEDRRPLLAVAREELERLKSRPPKGFEPSTEVRSGRISEAVPAAHYYAGGKADDDPVILFLEYAGTKLRILYPNMHGKAVRTALRTLDKPVGRAGKPVRPALGGFVLHSLGRWTVLKDEPGLLRLELPRGSEDSTVVELTPAGELQDLNGAEGLQWRETQARKACRKAEGEPGELQTRRWEESAAELQRFELACERPPARVAFGLLKGGKRGLQVTARRKTASPADDLQELLGTFRPAAAP